MTDQPETPNDPQQPQDAPGSTPPPPPSDAPASEGGAPNKDERNLAMLAHLLGIVLSIIGPLIIWAIKKDESKFIDDQAKEAMNFQIIPLIVYVVGGALSCLILPALIGMIMWIVVVIFCIIAAIKANEGVYYRYPFAWRLIK